ncbi:arsenate reductase ArsC [Salinisphaera sp. T31B1]|uniref:arsenate reductase ArsC n=1 Tax=Salinisphaera sp. T31B1 TaxID=727963 RepID=UPI0033414B71
MNILYVCTDNSCRSQIAEGWTRHLGGDRVSVRSAGLEAHGINPNAVATMQAVGIDISNQPSSVLHNADIEWADVVVTVCGHADEHCPVLPTGTRNIHWPLEDPARVVGNAQEIENAFATTRDAMRVYVEQLLNEPATTLN